MPRKAEFRIVVGVDGSAHSRAALATLIHGPWPDDARVRVVVARQTRTPHRTSILLAALDRSADDTAECARRTLADRWPGVEAMVVDKQPIPAILAEAKRFRSDLIVVGWRGYGTARRLLMGSVSRGVVRGAECAVLVVPRRPSQQMGNILLGFDGSANARRGVNLVTRLAPPTNGKVILVHAVELLEATARGPIGGGIRTSVARELRRINAERARTAERALDKAAKELKRAGWQTRTELRTGEPLRQLIDMLQTRPIELIVVGARGTSGVRYLLLGSVADGILSRSPVPVLLAR